MSSQNAVIPILIKNSGYCGLPFTFTPIPAVTSRTVYQMTQSSVMIMDQTVLMIV